MKSARETAAISLTKPLTPCRAQQVVRGGVGQAQSGLDLGMRVSPGHCESPPCSRPTVGIMAPALGN